MTNKQESAFSVIAALLVLFSSMISPEVSIILSVAAMLGFAIYKSRRP